MAENEKNLHERAVSGDDGALSELLIVSDSELRSRLSGQIGRRYRAVLGVADVLQVTYMEAFLRIGRFRPGGNGAFLNWLTRIAENNLRNAVRDLKPANIRLDPRGQPHVLDFGLAKINDEQAGGMQVTTTGQFVGSLPWATPEQLQNDPNNVDLRTDVYGLGLVLYFMLTQSLPYDRFGIARDVMDCILAGEHPPPSRHRSQVDDELDTIILKCLQAAPERRYQIAGEVARDIERYLAGRPIEAKRDSPAYLLVKTMRRQRANCQKNP